MKIVTAVVNNVDFIEIQYYTLKKFVKGEYEFIVFNDAKDFPDFTNNNDITIKDNIELMCAKLNIQCINIPNQHHKYDNRSSPHRTADSMNFILKYQIQNPDKYLLLDSDMFLIDNFDINKYSNYDCAIVLQSRHNFKTNYFWNGIYYFDMTKMKNINKLCWNCSPGTDVGGRTQEWLQLQMGTTPFPTTDELRWSDKTFHTDTIYFIQHLWSNTWNTNTIPDNIKDNQPLIDFIKTDFRNTSEKFYCEIYDNVFFHYRAGSNWTKYNQELHNQSCKSLKTILIDQSEN